MATSLNTIRRLTIEAKSVGLDRAADDLQAVAAGQAAVASSAVTMATSQDNLTRSVRGIESELGRLRSRIDPAYRATQAFEKGVRLLDRAMAQGKVTAEEYARDMARLETRYLGVNKAADMAAAAQARANAAMSGLSLSEARSASRSLGQPNFAVLGQSQTPVQQVREGARLAKHELVQMQYQLSDLAIQIAGGGSPFMAIMQQGSQLAPILGGQGGVRGAVTALGAGFMSLLSPVNLAIVGFGALAAGASYLFSTWDSGGDEMNDLLKRHADLVRQLKTAYEGTGRSVVTFERESSAALAMLEARSRRQLTKRFGSEAEDVLRQFSRGVIVPGEGLRDIEEAFPSIASAVDNLRRSMAAGRPDILGFREELLRAGDTEPANRGLQALIDKYIVLTDTLKDSQLQLRAFSVDAALVAREAERGANYERLSDALQMRNAGISYGIPIENVPRPGSKPNLLDFDPDAPETRRLEQADEAYKNVVKSAEDRIRTLQIEAATIGMTAEAATRYRVEQELLNQAIGTGKVLGKDENEELREKAATLSRLQIENERLQRLERDAIGAADDLRSFSKGVLSGFANDLRSGADAGEALLNVLNRIADKLLDMALDQAIAQLFGERGTLLGGLAGGLFGGRGPHQIGFGPAANSNIPGAFTGLATVPVTSAPLPPIGGSPAALGAFLAGGKPASHVTGMDPEFSAALSAMLGDAPPGIRDAVTINSGYRSIEHQQRLWDAALAKYGSPAAARKWVAPPGRSQHNFGNAADLGFGSSEARNWVHANAGNYGMEFPMSHEPWHIQGVQSELARFGETASQATSQLGTLGTGFDAFGNALSSFQPGSAGGGGFGALLGGLTSGAGGGGGFGVQFFAEGGIADKPAIFGDAGPEAAVPLSRGRRIPVELRTPPKADQAGRSTINVFNNAGATVEVEERKGPNGRETNIRIDRMKKDLKKEMQKDYGLRQVRTKR